MTLKRLLFTLFLSKKTVTLSTLFYVKMNFLLYPQFYSHFLKILFVYLYTPTFRFTLINNLLTNLHLWITFINRRLVFMDNLNNSLSLKPFFAMIYLHVC